MIINGKQKDIKPGITVIEMLEELNLSKDKVVVELNFEIIPKNEYDKKVLNKEDNIEIVSFVGGG
ncbi:MAG: sulfur carrier protein ThiS [Firmicutes bacterium]|nr:sulfur carrier protein ThiS [Bacillota bacterium]